MIELFKKRSYIIIGLVVLISSLTPLLVNDRVSAVSGADWRAGRIIDDAIFYNKDSMSVEQIQNFLNAKVPVCDRNRASSNPSYQPPWTCLKEYQENTTTKENNVGRFNGDGSPVSISGGKSAARIIWEVSRNYGLNPQVLIVMLQKEQSLITDNWPWKLQYDRAMGYACPDSGPGYTASCDSSYYGFYNQLDSAAWQLKRYVQYPDNYNFKAGVTRYIQYSPNPSCGGTNVYIENEATAALYNYTPYQPNAGALANLYGTSTCGAYGNRNFWRMFNDWFGTTHSVKVTAVPYDSTTDKTGEQALIGFKLSHQPKSDVYIKYKVSSPSNARFVGRDTVKITPNSWNKPDQNILKVVGLNNTGLEGNFRYWLIPERPVSNDLRYRGLSPEYVGSVSLLLQDNYNNPEVYRLADPVSGKYVFTASTIERDQKVSNGWVNEGVKFHYCYTGEKVIYKFSKSGEERLVVAGSQQQKDIVSAGFSFTDIPFSTSTQGNIPVYWQHDSTTDRSIYSTNPNEGTSAGFVSKGIVFYACEQTKQKTVYRLVNLNNGDHFYTISAKERDIALYKYQYRYEGLGFYVCDSGTTPVYRLANKENGDHFYTQSLNERNNAFSKYSYRDEGIGFYLCNDSDQPIYRLTNLDNGDHFYTAYVGERDYAINKFNYRDEGIGFYAE